MTMTKKDDSKAWRDEIRYAKINSAPCKCGHMKCLHIDWGNEGPCGLGSCECRKFELVRMRGCR